MRRCTVSGTLNGLGFSVVTFFSVLDVSAELRGVAVSGAGAASSFAGGSGAETDLSVALAEAG